MKVSNALNNANEGDIFEVTSTDRGYKSDIGAWCESTGNTLVDLRQDKAKIVATIAKGGQEVGNKVINNGN
jgi:TusA-related sulfurtransferase